MCISVGSFSLLLVGVPDRVMAANALQHITARFRRQHVVDKFPMAIQAGILSDHAIARLDLNGLVELAGGESDGMEQPIVRFRKPLA